MGTHFVFTIPVDIIQANQQAYTMMKLLAIFALVSIATASAYTLSFANATYLLSKAANAFASVDANKDGVIDALELVAAGSYVGIVATPSQAASIIKIVSGGNTMTLSDIQAITTEKAQAIAAKFN